MPPAPRDIQERVAAIEAELRALAALAAQAGDWPVVRASSLAAESLQGLGKVGTQESAGSGVRKERVRSAARRSPAASAASAAYPRFVGEAGDLVKIGWSRREKSEYRHRAPRSAMQLVARAVARLGTERESFSSDDLLPVIDPSDGSDVPAYQAYLVLRWLRHIGLVEQTGRSEYRVPDPAGLVAASAREWKRLDTKKESA